MNLEKLDQANLLASEIRYAERYEIFLNDEEVLVRIDRNRHYGFEEEAIELTPEEEAKLKAIRKSYLAVLRTANSRKLEQLRKEFEKI